MDGLDAGTGAGKWLIEQGGFGVAIFFLIGAVIYLERKRIQLQDTFQAQVKGLEEKHAIELASAWKYSRDLQERRVVELQANVDSQNKAIDLAATLFKKAGDSQ